MSRTTSNARKSKIAVLVPCYNEELTVAGVVAAFKSELPDADIYVFDNNSTDRTIECALAAGAIVSREPRQGKGFVIQSMFRQIEADIYVMVDGDATYPAPEVHTLIEPVLKGEADMVVGSRLRSGTNSEFRQINRLGNRLVLALLNSIFGVRLTDILSGYRAFSRDFVKSLPLFGGGFEIETELTIKAIARGWRIVEIPTTLTSRPEGSHSKINLFRDGALIINTILALFRDYKPLTFFGTVGLIIILVSLIPAIFIAIKVPSMVAWVVLLVGMTLTGMVVLVAGLILHTIVRRFQEIEHNLHVQHDELAFKVKRIEARNS